IILQGPEASAAVDYAMRNGRDEIKFIVGGFPQHFRQLIYEGKSFGPVDQDPYPQAYNAMKMAWLHFNGKDSEIPRPNFLPRPLIAKETREDARGVGVLKLGAWEPAAHLTALARARTLSIGVCIRS